MDIRDQIIKRLVSYIEVAENWDVCEIAEWVFGHDDPTVEKFREATCKKEKRNES